MMRQIISSKLKNFSVISKHAEKHQMKLIKKVKNV